MKNQSVLIWGIISLLIVAVVTLGGLAWVLAGAPALEAGDPDLEAALETARAFEITRQANPLPPTPLGLTPESLRPPPTSLAEFRVLPPTFTPPPSTPTIFGDPALVLGDFSWINAFEFGAISVDSVDTCALMQIIDGRFRVGAEGRTSEYCKFLIQPESRDYFVQVSSEVIGACNDGEFGLYFRGNNNKQGAYFGLTCAGDYRLVYEVEDKGGVIVADTSSRWVNAGAGQINRLGILAVGDRVSLYANGALLAETSDPVFLDGQFLGLFVRTPGGDPVTVNFDNLTFWDLTDK